MPRSHSGIRGLEARLAELLGTPKYARDDQRLARAYLKLAEQFRPQMDSLMTEVFQSLSGGDASVEDRQRLLGEVRRVMRGQAGESIDRVLYQIADACLRPGFTIDPDTDTYPVYTLAKLGFPLDKLEEVLKAEYPEIVA